MPATDDPFEFSLTRFLDYVARNRRAVLGTPIVLGILVLVTVLILPRHYSSSVSFLPQAEQTSTSGLASLASQFGVSLPIATGGESLDFYARLLASRPVLEKTVTSKYRGAGSDAEGPRDLLERFHAHGSDSARRVEDGMKELRKRMQVQADARTGLVTLTVTTRDPELSREIAARMIDLVNEFNVSTRRTQAAAQLDFVETQVIRAQAAVTAVEDTLESFLRANRRYDQSPALTFEHDRLARRVETLQSVLTSLLTAREQARIDAVRTTPVITVVEPAYLPAKPDRRYLLPKAFFATLLGFLVMIVGVGARDALAAARARDPAAYVWLDRWWGVVRSRLRRGR